MGGVMEKLSKPPQPSLVRRGIIAAGLPAFGSAEGEKGFNLQRRE
jgi:hypothetical protein